MNKSPTNIIFKNNALLFGIIDQSDNIILITQNKNKQIIYANKSAQTLLNYTQEELLTKELTDLRITKKEDLKNRNSITFDTFQTKDFQELHLETQIQYIDDFIVYISKKYEQTLHDEVLKRTNDLNNQKIFLNTLINNAPTSIFYKDVKGRYLGSNEAWEKLTGLKGSDVINKSVYDIAPKDIAKIYAQQDEKVFNLEENPQIYKSQVYNKQEDKLSDVVFYKSAFFDTKGDVAGLIGVVIDITDITTLEKEKAQKEKIIYHQSKMAAMGEMIENIAHQWRQPLSIISTAASGIKMQKEFDFLTDEMLNKSLEGILTSSEHLSRTIDDFRDFFKPNKPKSNFKVQHLIKKTLSLISSKLKNRDITIITDIENIDIFGLENEFVHILINIMNNAYDVLNVTLEQEKFIFIQCYKTNHYLVITIRDTAGGIDEKIIDRIFEPYFTTKHQKQGTGIGLYMTEEIIKKHMNGFITVKNKSFEYKKKNYTGAQFSIKIPL